MLTPPGRRTSIVADDAAGLGAGGDGNIGVGSVAAGTGADSGAIEAPTGSTTPAAVTSATWTSPGSDADDNRRARIDQYRTMLNDTPR